MVFNTSQLEQNRWPFAANVLNAFFLSISYIDFDYIWYQVLYFDLYCTEVWSNFDPILIWKKQYLQSNSVAIIKWTYSICNEVMHC